MFIHLTTGTALQLVLLGFIGGVLSGFIGSGGAFFMTPGMMNFGIPGVVAVASNITHKFGKAMVGSRAHGKMGHVDKRLGFFLLGTSLVGILLAALVNKALFHTKGSHGEGGGAAGDLYISMVFLVILGFVAFSMLKDVLGSRKGAEGPSTKLVSFFTKFQLPPRIHFRIADVKVSIWLILLVGLATGYLAGTIGVGGFIGVPAMIYVFGVPTAVAAGTELFLAQFMGAWGALTYAVMGVVDLRLTLLLYLGSLLGIFVGVYGTKLVKEVYIRSATGIIILLCVVSRAIAIPVYLRQLGWMEMDPRYDVWLNGASKFLLYASGLSGVLFILVVVIREHVKRRRIRASISVLAPGPEARAGASPLAFR